MPKQKTDIGAHLIAWKSSGLSQAAYCRKSGIAYHRLRDGLHRQGKRRAQSSGFVEIPRPASGPVAVLELPSGLRLGFAERADAGWIGRLIRSLVASC